MSHRIYAAKFEQTIIHQHVHVRRKSQSHAPAHVLMRLYPIDKSLVCLQSERRTYVRILINHIFQLVSCVLTKVHPQRNQGRACMIRGLEELSPPEVHEFQKCSTNTNPLNLVCVHYLKVLIMIFSFPLKDIRIKQPSSIYDDIQL